MMKKLIAMLLVLVLAGTASASFSGGVIFETYDGAAWSNGEAIEGSVATPNNGWFNRMGYPGRGWCYDTTGYLGDNRGAMAVSPQGTDQYMQNHHFLLESQASVETGIHTFTWHVNVDDDPTGEAGILMFENATTSTFRTDNKVALSFYGSGATTLGATAGSTLLTDAEDYGASGGYQGKGWVEWVMTNDLTNDTVSAKWRDLDDTTWGYAAASSWVTDLTVDYSANGSINLTEVGVYTDAGTTVLADACVFDNINNGIPEPVTLAVLAVGGLMALLRRRR